MPFTTRKVTSTNGKITVFMMKWKESGRLRWFEGTSLYHSFLEESISIKIGSDVLEIDTNWEHKVCKRRVL